ncbi:glutathione S-transferase [Kiloniella sp. EL199]|uniref:glutathione S-transferase n=1 Tax=Kiloniella sp. EL199 TaxID=2107581 RepID=UPI000EA3CAB0|nr:glutathione S-transferase [Kiloniella sp. EL199]
MPQKIPLLYSFRRCPYAMRARLGLQSSHQICEIREIVLRNKPTEMLQASPKGTVPVLVLSNDDVLEESLDIMLWALNQNDPESWLNPEIGTLDTMLDLINRCEVEFKEHLDRYKYAPRYEGADPIMHRTQAEDFLDELNKLLTQDLFLFGSRRSLADMAIAPFIRQFANVDRAWFDQTNYPHLKLWLYEFLDSSRFKGILKKYPVWATGDPITYFPEQHSD